jgi:RNA 3'-terminal phosphate cyclase (ATP)
MLEIDGSRGEGGGQILRSALALSILTRKPFKLINIRANRPKPGLAPQHLASVRAAAAISSAIFKGGQIGSAVLNFEPHDLKSGNYTFGINTAGATALVLHTVYLPLALHGTGESQLTLTGGTHVKAAPSFDFLATTWTGYLKKLGMEVEVELVRPGFYPRGGGEVRVRIRPCSRVYPLTLLSQTDLKTAGGFGAIADLPESIAKTLSRRLKHRLKQDEIESEIPTQTWENGPGAVASVVFRQAPVPTLFFALGEKGRPAEVVADEAADEALAYKASSCPVDPHSADQLLLPLVFSDGASEFRVSEVTQHLLTNIETIRLFVERDIQCEGERGQPGTVRIAARSKE